MRHRPYSLPILTLGLVALLVASHGCRRTKPTAGPSNGAQSPTMRLYVMSSIAGAIEPCGCSKDQLGGLDHFAAYVQAEKAKTPRQIVLAAGPLYFLDPTLKTDHLSQDKWKAEAISMSMKRVGLRAWAPGLNDWAAGSERLKHYMAQSGAKALGVGIESDVPVSSSMLHKAGDLSIGIIGISEPKSRVGLSPKGTKLPTREAATRAVQEQVSALRKQGATIFVALAALPRGAALRIADRVPDLHVLAVGPASSHGDANTKQLAPEMIGRTLVVETANHAQTASIIDIFVTVPHEKPIQLSDAGGVQRAAQIAELSSRVRDLEHRINGWEKGGKINEKDLAARKKDLKKFRKERAALEAKEVTVSGNFFRYRVLEIRDGLGQDPKVGQALTTYYKRVNDHNKQALADRKPATVAKGEARYIGISECESCHLEAQEVWEKTAHAKAYKTLVDDHKEFNLDCVSCHVTGYGIPGGSTVTHNDTLRNVQCETCHGPGSLHVEDPENPKLITLKPDPKTCVDQCHHPPHVEGFDASAKMDLVLGPGHGK